MRETRLQRWALTAEIIGGIAVVLSLALVAYELRQSNEQAALNTSALQIAAYQNLIESINSLNAVSIEHPVVLSYEAISNGNQQDRARANVYLISLFRHGDMAFFQYERGAIDEVRLRSVLRILTDKLDEPYVRQLWDKFKVKFVPSYRNYVDNLITENANSQND